MKNKTLLSDFSKFVSLNILGMIGLSCYILADTFFVANGIGANGLAALNLAIPIYSFIHGIGLMIGIGGATKYVVLKAQNNSKADSVFTHSIILGAFFGVALLIVGLTCSDYLSRLLGADSETFSMTRTYMKTILCFSPFFIMNNILIAFIRNDKAPNLAMSGMIVGSLSNILLDYIFVFPLGGGMFGAALATGIAPIISIALLSVHFFRRKNTFHIIRCKISIKNTFHIMSLGISSLITEISSGIILIVFNIVILGIAGNIGVAAYGVVANLSLVAISIFVGIAQGMQPLVSHCYGQNNKNGQHDLLKYSIVFGFAIAICIYLAVNILGEQIIAAFNSEKNEQLAAFARSGIRIYFTGFIFAGLNVVVISYFSASHRAKKAFVLSITRGFIAMLPLVLLLSNFFGLIGVWLVFPLSELITTVVIIIMYLRQHRKIIA